VNKAVTNGTLALASSDGGNYNLLTSGNTLTITKLDTNISGTRTYDQTATAAGANLTTISALIAGDVVSVTGAGTVADKNVAVNKAVTNGTLALASSDGGNYNLLTSGNTLTITRAALALNAVTDTKVYDGGVTSTATPTTSGLVVGDTVGSLTQAFASKNVLGLNGSTLNVNGGYVVNDGNAGGNYTVTLNSATGTINKLGVTLTAPAVTKTYDGGTTYATTAGDLTSIGSVLVGGDTVSVATIAYANRDFGIANKTVTLSGSTISDGNGGLNYTILAQNGNATSTINKANLTVTAQTDTRGYNGTVSSAVAPVVTGTLYDAVGTAATQSYDTKNVGITKTLTASGLVVNDGNSGNNYAIGYVTNLTGAINPAALSIRADDTGRPEGAPNPPFTATYGGFQAGETPAVLAGTLSFSTPATVSSPVGSYSITPFGRSSTNYAITYVNGTLTVSTSVISPPVNMPTFLNPIIQATNFWVPDPYIVADSTDEESIIVAGGDILFLKTLPSTAGGPADGVEPVAQFEEQPSRPIQSDWQCFRHAIWTKMPPRYCGLK
jgi:hypothetical protein